MCGICGIYDYRAGGPVEAALLCRMNATIVHRGPDDEGSYVAGPIGLAMRRLSIIDVEGGHQPIHNEDGTASIVFNGEIYNFLRIRDELLAAGHVFRTRSDSETILHAYEEWGDDCTLRFNGVFAFAIWDVRRRRLLLARDHFGVKPLYYRDDGTRLVFASEIKAILADDRVPRRVDTGALDLFLTFRYVPSPLTMFEGIRKLAPGHRLICDERGVRTERYWNPSPRMLESLSEREAVDQMRGKLRDAVERQMLSDVPVGALLSGGIDSAVVVAIMSRLAAAPVKTFTIGFSGGGTSNELADARDTARRLGTDHREILVERDEYLEMLDTAVYHMDEPISTTTALAVYLVCRLAREHVKVVLTGQGADEPLAGYHRYYAERYGDLYRQLPGWLRERAIRPLVERLPRRERLKRAVRTLGIRDVTARFARVYDVYPPDLKAALWRGERRPPEEERPSAEALVDYWRSGVNDLPALAQMTFVDARLWLSDELLIIADKMSMAASVEARVPYLDLEYMAFVEALPPRLRIKGWTRKYLHKRAVTAWLPADIVRRRKRGFESPMDQWFRTELSGAVGALLLGADSASAEYFTPALIARLFDDHVAGREDHHRQIFSLLMFELWHRKFIAPRPAPLR